MSETPQIIELLKKMSPDELERLLESSSGLSTRDVVILCEVETRIFQAFLILDEDERCSNREWWMEKISEIKNSIEASEINPGVKLFAYLEFEKMEFLFGRRIA